MLLQADSTQIELARETLYWAKVSGLSDAVVAVLGLTSILSILVTRWGLLSQAKRAQVEDAVVRCEEMRKEIVPLLEQMLSNFASNNVKRFVSDGSKVSFPKEIDDAKAEKALQWVRSLNPEGRELILRLLNRLETWSMHFNHGLADPDVAFLPCATIYSSVVVMLYAPIITMRHNNPRSGPYQNVVDLFDRWYRKQRMEKIQEEVSKLQDAGAFKAPPKK
jgi:hypothetical protein